MKINHIALYTNNLEKMKEFYIKYFNGNSNEMYHNKITGLQTYFISFDDDTRLELMTRSNLLPVNNEDMRVGFIHLAFSVGNKENVDKLTRMLTDDGYEHISGPRVTGDGYYESCVKDPDGNLLEITE